MTPADAFNAAREVYLSGQRLDMRELAANLGVARTTLYRWCGDREQLRDFGLMLAALTLARLAAVYDPPLQLRRR